MSSPQDIRVAVAGFGWMGRVHTQAYSRIRHHYPHLALTPTLASVADEVPGRAEEAATQYEFQASTSDWHDIETDSSIDAVSQYNTYIFWGGSLI